MHEVVRMRLRKARPVVCHRKFRTSESVICFIFAFCLGCQLARMRLSAHLRRVRLGGLHPGIERLSQFISGQMTIINELRHLSIVKRSGLTTGQRGTASCAQGGNRGQATRLIEVPRYSSCWIQQFIPYSAEAGLEI